MNEIKKATTNDKKADIILLSSIKKETCGKNYDSHLNDSDNDASLSEQNFNDSASSTGSGCEQQNIKHDGDEDPHKEKDEKVLGNGREARNKAEKNRRDKLNGSIQELSGMVPHVAESQRRVDKTAVLRYAAHGLRINHVFGNADENNAQLKSETIDSLLKLLDSVLITISIRGQIILVTSNVEQHLGHCQTDLYGQNILNFIHPEDHTLVKTQLVPTNIETLFDLNSDIDAEESRPRTQEEEDLIDTKLQDDKRNFTVRFARAGPRSEPTSYEIVQINGYFRRADFAPRGAKSNTLPSGLQLIRRTRGRDDGIPLHTISGNDIALVCFAKVIKPPSMCDRLLEACKYEYKTRHLIDGRIVQCDQRISVVAGYMTEEVSGLSPFTFMHKDDVRWVIVALRQMYDNSKPYGESCYRLMTRTGQFIYLRTRGFLEIDDESNKVHSFYCINTLVTEDDGKKLVREMKKKFSVIINQIEIGETEEMPSVENPQQIEKAVLNLITNLNPAMSLLPKSHEEFSQTDYWNKFFKLRGKSAFEWYGEYPELCEQLHKYIKLKDDILMVGCGNSKLSADLYDVGFNQLTNIDISHVVIRQMNDLNKTQRPNMKFIQMDATQMEFTDEQFSVVLDKGTLDALMSDDSESIKQNTLKYFAEVERVLKTAGRYVCVSLLQEHIINILLEYFPKNNFMFRVVRCLDVERKTAETNNDLMNVFLIVATKFKKLPMQVLEISLGGDKMKRATNPNEIISAIQQCQKAAMICNGLHKGSIADYNEISLDLYKPDETVPRFSIFVVDKQSTRGNSKFAAFIVPQGRETDWLFSTKQGRNKLIASTNFDRLAIVSMHRGQIYKSWDDVKNELSENITSLAPQNLREKIPYLSLGTEVGKRETIYTGKSEHSGEFIVEETSGDDNKILRRLVFLSNQFVIQSEASIKLVKGKKRIDLGYLACQHHLYMSVGVKLTEESIAKPNVLVIGLGGGGLCTFMHQCLRNIQITAVDLDPIMLEMATKYFGLVTNENLKVEINDGIEYLRTAALNKLKFDSIIFDVDNKDSSLGLSCPPLAFVSAEVLSNVKKCLTENGTFILNLVCRDDKLKSDLLDDLRKSFSAICVYQVEEEINEILYCRVDVEYKNMFKSCFEKAAASLNMLAKKNKLSNDELICVEEFISELKI